MKLHDFTQDYEFTMGSEKSGPHSHDVSPYFHKSKGRKGKKGKVCENLETEVEPNEISLSSFKVRDGLEGRIWQDGVIDSRVRLKLLKIADDFWKGVNIKWVKPEGVILTGSICNYNWSEFSDIDLHIIVDFSKVHKRTDFVREYFNEKKNTWNGEHDKLIIYGFNVEVYVQDVDDKVTSGGVYDLERYEWLRKPNRDNISPIGLNKYDIKDIASRVMTRIDDLSDDFYGNEDNHNAEVIGKKCNELINRIHSMRKRGLKDGEMGLLNIVYKVLRRTEYMDKLYQLRNDIYDKVNSINESRKFEEKIRKGG